MNRRDFFSAAAAAGVSVSLAPALTAAGARQPGNIPQPKIPGQRDDYPETVAPKSKGRIKQSICRWCYGGMDLAVLATTAKGIGYQSIELLGPDEWPVVKKAGMDCAVAGTVKSNPIHKGFNRTDLHDAIVKDLEERLPLVKAAGIPNQIVMSGNRDGMDDKTGLKNCAAGLKRILPLAEKLGVTIIMELLNSRVDHKDYMCDKSEWGIKLVEEVASDRFKLLYDIYHMQIMEGDVIRTIQNHGKHIAHYHTGGNPGRNEIDETQELNYKAICKAIADSGFTGYLAQEFIPKRDPVASLKQAFETCTV